MIAKMKLFIVLLIIQKLIAKEIEDKTTIHDMLLESENDVSGANSIRYGDRQTGELLKNKPESRVFRGPLRKMFPTFKERKNILPENSGTSIDHL